MYSSTRFSGVRILHMKGKIYMYMYMIWTEIKHTTCNIWMQSRNDRAAHSKALYLQEYLADRTLPVDPACRGCQGDRLVQGLRKAPPLPVKRMIVRSWIMSCIIIDRKGALLGFVCVYVLSCYFCVQPERTRTCTTQQVTNHFVSW